MSKYAENIAALEARRAATVAKMEEIQDRVTDEGRTKDESEREQVKEFKADIKAIDDELTDLRDLESMSKATAKAVDGSTEKTASESRGGVRVELKSQPKLAPGIEFARAAKCYAMANGSAREAVEIAKDIYGENANVVGTLTASRNRKGLGVEKAVVVAGSTATGTWAGNLVGDETGAYADFVEYLRPMTILGKFGNGGVPSLRQVPFRVALVGQTGAGAGYWVGEGKAKPLTAFDFSRTTLEPLKVANIAVLTEEVIRDSSPAADAIIRDQLVEALRARLDTDFIDPAKAAVSGISPASITNGATAIAATSFTDADDIRLDIRSVFQTFINANNAPTSGVWIMSHGNALALSILTNGLGQAEFPGMSMTGGTLQGLPVIASEYAGTNVILVNASDIYLGDEGGFQIDLSREASLEMADNPTGSSVATVAAASLVSMFQTNSVAFRAERTINWAARRSSAVAYLTGVAWGGAVNVS